MSCRLCSDTPNIKIHYIYGYRLYYLDGLRIYPCDLCLGRYQNEDYRSTLDASRKEVDGGL